MKCNRVVPVGVLWVVVLLGPGRAWGAATDGSTVVLDDATRATCLKILREAVRSDGFWPSMHAAEALTLAGYGAEVRPLLEPKLAAEKDDQRRCGLARELVRAGDRAKAQVMLDILAGADTHGHVHACESLYKVNEIGDGRLMRAAMRQTANPTQALMAAAALGRRADPEALAMLRERVRSDDPKTARISAWILARIGDQTDIPALRAGAARFKDPLVRATFEHALAARGDVEGLAALARNLKSPDPKIRTYAAVFAGEAQAPVADELVRLLEDKDVDVRVRAAQSLLVMARAERDGLAWPDWLIIAVYACSTIGLGWYFSRRQRTTQEYFTGGGHMNWALIGVSLFATLLSTISYLSMPGEAAGKGPMHMTSLLALPLVFVVVGFVLLPVYMRNRVTSAYELLEARLGLSVRMLGMSMFLVLRLVWMSLLIYLAARAMTVMLGVDDRYIWLIVLATGFVSITYTSLGGLRAVVVTDLMQTILLFGGALLVIATVSIDFGGFGWFPTQWQANWDTQPLFSLDPGTRLTVVGSIASVLIWYVCTAGGDQVSVQRFMATENARAARRAFGTQLTVAALVGVTLGVVGFAILGYFRAHPEALPAGADLKSYADHMFPRYIAFHLPVGVSGLVVAAMFAAAMSSIDSGVNSITAVVMTDLLDRFGRKPETERGHVLTAKLLAFGIGATVVVGSSFMEYIPGNITSMTNKTVNLLVPSIFCLFLFALFVPFARPAGVWLGWLFGTATAVLIAFSGPIFGFDPETGYDPISFQWIGPAALLVNVAVGMLVSLALGARKPGQ